MMQDIRVEIDGRGVARLTLARSGKHNALSARMMREIVTAAERLATDERVRVVVLEADGPTFCAGGDLAWMREQFDMDAPTRRRASAQIAEALGALYALPQPLIARVQGNAFGGGIGMISVCDVAVGLETAKFALTEVKLGLIPANIGPYVIARMGAVKAAASAAAMIRCQINPAAMAAVTRAVMAAITTKAAVSAKALPLTLWMMTSRSSSLFTQRVFA